MVRSNWHHVGCLLMGMVHSHFAASFHMVKTVVLNSTAQSTGLAPPTYRVQHIFQIIEEKNLSRPLHQRYTQSNRVQQMYLIEQLGVVMSYTLFKNVIDFNPTDLFCFTVSCPYLCACTLSISTKRLEATDYRRQRKINLFLINSFHNVHGVSCSIQKMRSQYYGIVLINF